MISILVCSVNEGFRNKLLESIKASIGVEFEFIYQDNSKDKSSIAQVYNSLKKRAKGQYLCFLHEDIEFHSPNWGCELIKLSEADESVGLIGIAGSLYKSDIPSGWGCVDPKFLVLNYRQKNSTSDFSHHSHALSTEVVCIDGVFMFMQADLAKRINFNEDIIKGFHGYDLDLSMQVLLQQKKVIVTNAVCITHFSAGSPNVDWYNTHLALGKCYKNILPKSLIRLSRLEKAKNEYNSFFSGLNAIKKHPFLIFKHFWSFFEPSLLLYFFNKHLAKK